MNKGLKCCSILTGVGVITIAVFGLLGYVPGLKLLGSIKPGYIPMALSTALSFISLGVVQLLINTNQLNKVKQSVILLVVFLVFIFGGLEVIGFFIGHDLSFEDRIVPAVGDLKGIPLGRMSPATGAAFVISGIAIFFLVFHCKNTSIITPIKYVRGIASLLVLLVGFVFCLAYIFGVPLLYGSGSTIPMALTTALGFLFLSFSILTSEKDPCFINLLTGTSTYRHLLCLILPLSISSLLIGGLSALYLSHYLNINPAFISAIITILIVVATSFVASYISHYLAFEIDSAKTQLLRTHKTLIDSEERLRLCQLYGKIGTWEADFITNQQIWSEAVTQELGFPNKSSPVWDDFLSTIYPEDRDYVVKKHHLHCYEGKEFDIEFRIIDTQQNIRWVRSSGKAEIDSSGQPVLMRGTVQDITNQKIIEQKLQLSSRVFTETKEGIIITNTQGFIVDVNPSFCEITGYTREEVINHNPNILSSGKQNTEFYVNMWKSINELGYWQGEIWNRKKEGTLYAELLSISSIADEEGNILNYIGIFTDITNSKKQQESLELLAHYDMLTKLPNRVLLADRFTQALAHCKRQENQLAVCFLDLDYFKPINDLYGHGAGDKLLVEVAERLTAIIRDEDTVSRQGGDEFVLLLSDIDSFTECEQMLKRIIASIAQPYLIEGLSLSISASIGVSLYPLDDSDLDTLMRHSDQAMYQAKQAGRNCYHLFNAQQDKLDSKRNIKLNEIKSALIKKEFCLYFQPKVDMPSGNVIGAEALIRWNHTEKGVIPPLKFLPFIEGTELETQVGIWVINEALNQLDKWKKQGIDLEVSVNVSSYHLQHLSFVDDLETALANYPKVHSKNLQLEILESSALGNIETITNIIKTCNEALGVSVALDDFGTGYSSLTHLRNLPAKTIKIDQTFIRDLLDDPNDLAIIDGVIGLSNSFNRKLIAEGVETTEHGLVLLVMGCNEAQGYGISRPLPDIDFQNWLFDYRPNQEWISCANKDRTQKDKKIKLFKLTFAKWKERFVNKLQSSPGNIGQWPILERTKCHGGIWIKRARQDQIFEERWLIKLEEAHNVVHETADDLFKRYHENENESGRLKDFEKVSDQLISILEQCE